MLLSIVAYGCIIRKSKNDPFYQKHFDLITSIRKEEKSVHWAGKTIFAFENEKGQDHYFIGSCFGVVTEDQLLPEEFAKYIQERDYVAEFNVRINKYPELATAISEKEVQHHMVLDHT